MAQPRVLEFAVLSSGSKANCLYVGGRNTRVLIDCGLSAKEAAKRLDSLGLDADSIDAIVITHEHADHTAGVKVFSNRHNTAVYANAKTFNSAGRLRDVSVGRRCLFETGFGFEINELSFNPFAVSHDAADPVAFRISTGGRSLGIVTDLGEVTEVVRENSAGLHALVLESNHCPVMLEESAYPWLLKERISGARGHLSNEAAAELLGEICLEQQSCLEILVAAHISENSNTPELAKNSFVSAWSGSQAASFPGIYVAGVSYPTELFKIS